MTSGEGGGSKGKKIGRVEATKIVDNFKTQFKVEFDTPSGGARDSMLPGHSQVDYLANQVKRKSKSRNIMPPCHRPWHLIDSFNVLVFVKLTNSTLRLFPQIIFQIGLIPLK